MNNSQTSTALVRRSTLRDVGHKSVKSSTRYIDQENYDQEDLNMRVILNLDLDKIYTVWASTTSTLLNER